MLKQNEQEQNTKGHHGQSNKRHKPHYYGVLAVRLLFCFGLFRRTMSVSGAGAATCLPGASACSEASARQDMGTLKTNC